MLIKTEQDIKMLFNCIDEMDTKAFLGFLTNDVKFRFGNAPVAEGNTAVGEAVGSFFSSIKSIQHELTETWYREEVIICHGNVTYTRHDSTILRVPFANILTMENNLVNDYLIFVDISGLYY